MGFDIIRFVGEVDEELLCPICTGVLQDPVQAPVCEHAYCKGCILEWLLRQSTCPVDRLSVNVLQLRPVPRILKNLLSRLYIFCENSNFGCNSVVKLDSLDSHLTECEYNPKRPFPCEQGCGLIIPKDEHKDHNCVKELRELVQKQNQKINDMQQEMAHQKLEMTSIKDEMRVLKNYVRSIRVCNPSAIDLNDELERDEIERWSNTLPQARVTRWGGMISTPDEYLQNNIKQALIESGCPSHILDDLVKNCHERNWPSGLSSLETRQHNRRHYDRYNCKRLPGKQAVIVLPCDNIMVSDEMMAEPGLIMIFAHGIE
ncbi:E3 ubiquitin-protein ligase NRDP1 [Sipha flava]|uniref:E3 ubiquitin-protein ligase NRDP1 n=1 Tax=Sipha flava TaxID=143950 RepID=A0A8B8G5G1_9HEMI|nr:E3 ubiquitin-protein ligase NRDP1 [Sipha flava]